MQRTLSLRFALCLASMLAAQDVSPLPPPSSPLRWGHVLHDAADGRTPWATGSDWKASFGPDGFTFVPFFGATARSNFPVRFHLRSLRAGGHELPFAGQVPAVRTGDRYEYDRGVVRERYELTTTHVEQTIVVDTPRPGDLEVSFAVISELAEDANRPGVQFANELGAVGYGDAFVVLGAERIPVATTFADGMLTIRVSASLRGDGPVVIDPIVNTQPTGWNGAPQSGFPDVAYDATHRVWMCVYEYPFSASDMDIVCEMFDHDGNVILNSVRSVDQTMAWAQQARIANHNESNKFLIVCERSDPSLYGGRWQVFTMTIGATTAGSGTPLVLTSDPSLYGSARSPDVGGDPGTTGAADFPVVWLQGAPTNRAYVRWVRPTGQVVATAPALLASNSAPFSNLRISKSNGRGKVAVPVWLVVFSMLMSGTHSDIVGVPIYPAGVGAGLPYSITVTAADDRYPSVAAPFPDAAGAPLFALTYERQVPAEARAVVYNPTTQQVASDRDLTPLGIGPYWLRIQSDGLRFACTSSANGSTINLSLLVYDLINRTWSLQDGPHPLAGAPSFPSLASTADSGGGLTAYSVAYLNANSGDRIALARYEGRGAGPVFAFDSTGCNGLTISWTDYPWLGNTIGFPLSGYGADFPCTVLGLPASAPVTLCSSCQVGLRLDVPVQLFPGVTQLDVAIPQRPELVGSTFAVQGIALGSGPCFAGLTLGDTIQFTIR